MAWKKECIKRSSSVTESARQQVLEAPSIIPFPRRSAIKNGMNRDANRRQSFKSGINYESKRRQRSVLSSKVGKANRAELIRQRRSSPPNFGLSPVTVVPETGPRTSESQPTVSIHRHCLLNGIALKKRPRVGHMTSLVPTELNFGTGPQTPKSQPTVSNHRHSLLGERAPAKRSRVGHVTSLVPTGLNFETGPRTPKSQPTVSSHRHSLLGERAPKKRLHVGVRESLVPT